MIEHHEEKEFMESPIRGRVATPEEESWLIYRRQTEQETPKRLEEVAKYLSGMISIAFTIFLTPDGRVFERSDSMLVEIACMVWLLALLAAFFVIFPLRWAQVAQSAENIQQVHRASVRYKYILLVVSVALFMLALGMLALIFVLEAK